MTESPRTDRLGVSKVEHFFSLHGWLFREQYLHDYGIDGQVEVVESNQPTGNLIALQIKSGKSYFSESNEHGVVFRTDDAHIDYWFRHALPIILVLYDPVRDMCIWESVNEDTILSTGSGWKILIPHGNVLNESSLQELSEITQPPEYIKKLNKLRLDKKWIDLLAEGESLYIEFENWIHKSLPRFSITIGCDSKDDIELESWPTLYGPGLSMEEAIAHSIPWADYEMDLDAHYEFMESVWYDECYISCDEDTGEPYFSVPFEDWYEEPEDIVPVCDNGETQGYRLLLSLNKVGQAFYDLDEYLSENDDIDVRAFIL